MVNGIRARMGGHIFLAMPNWPNSCLWPHHTRERVAPIARKSPMLGGGSVKRGRIFEVVLQNAVALQRMRCIRVLFPCQPSRSSSTAVL